MLFLMCIMNIDKLLGFVEIGWVICLYLIVLINKFWIMKINFVVYNLKDEFYCYFIINWFINWLIIWLIINRIILVKM